MSYLYDDYLKAHKHYVLAAFLWIKNFLPDLIKPGIYWETLIGDHDKSKYDAEEYNAYDTYFYGGNKSYAVVQNFNKAWLRHIHQNPHHWQYWILINDDPLSDDICIEMPYEYVIEMICDWWSFSHKTGNVKEIFSWYEERKNHIRLNSNTKLLVESILEQMQNKIQELEDQGWDVLNNEESKDNNA